MTLEDLKWKNRVVLVFPANGGEDITFSDSLLHEIDERKIVYFVYGDSIKSNLKRSFSPAYLEQVRSKYQLGYKDDTYVLMGLDGGVKLRKDEALDWTLIFSTIDSMPMRKSEMRRN